MLQRKFRTARPFGAALFICLLGASPALAHPHVWMDVKADYVIGDGHTLDAIRITWTFDEFYTAFAVGDFKKQKDGSYAEKDLATLLKVNLDNLKDPEWHYFTEVKQNGKSATFKEAIAGASTYDKKLGRLTSTFTLPLATPMTPTKEAPVQIRIYDPTFYIDLEYVKDNPIHLVGAGHEGCTFSADIPDEEKVWSQLPKSAFSGGDGSAAQGFGSYFASTVTLVCAAS
jgi:ABC-type uncharacterized transport system substrate-binding protein